MIDNLKEMTKSKCIVDDTTRLGAKSFIHPNDSMKTNSLPRSKTEASKLSRWSSVSSIKSLDSVLSFRPEAADELHELLVINFISIKLLKNGVPKRPL